MHLSMNNVQLPTLMTMHPIYAQSMYTGVAGCSDEFTQLIACLTSSSHAAPDCTVKYQALIACLRTHGMTDGLDKKGQ